MKPLVNVCTPVYYSGPATLTVLDDLLASLRAQDYPQDRLRPCLSVQQCPEEVFPDIIKLLVQYKCASIFPNKEVNGPATNTNSAMSIAEEGYVKIMNQDDLLDSPTAISDMVEALENSEARWLASACTHTDSVGVKRERLHIPSWPGEKAMVEGMNRIGCPSVVMFESNLSLECDVNVLYAMDCDMWIQLFRQAGAPLIHRKPDVTVRMWESQLTENLNIPRQLELDKAAMRKKYGYV